MAARPYGLVMCCYRHRLYTTIDRLVVQFREIHDRLPTLEGHQPTTQPKIGWLRSTPFFGSCIWGEQIDFLWFSCILLIKCKRYSEDILFTLFLRKRNPLTFLMIFLTLNYNDTIFLLANFPFSHPTF